VKYVNEVAVTLGALLGRFRRPAAVDNSKASDGKTPDVIPQGFTPIPEFLPEDIFIVGYPRSGNTWFENLVLSAVYGVDPRWMPNGLAQELVPYFAFPGDLYSPRKYYRRYATPMLFHSHALPRPECRRVVYLLRDGRDVLVSYWHYREALDGVEYDFLTFVSEIFLYPCRWEQHVSAWLDNPFGAQVLVVKFEDLIQEPVRELKRFCEFAGISRDIGHLIGSAEAASFQNSRNRELRMGHGWPDYPFPRDKSFFRRGKIGSYKEEMPHEVLEKFLADAGETMRRCGYLTDSEFNRGTGAESPTATGPSP
jgi:Sulfotransferase domain